MNESLIDPPPSHQEEKYYDDELYEAASDIIEKAAHICSKVCKKEKDFLSMWPDLNKVEISRKNKIQFFNGF